MRRLLLISVSVVLIFSFAAAFASEIIDVAVLEQVEPSYPREALIDCKGGTVYLSFVVTPDGQAENIRVTDSTRPGLFDEAAISAVQQWKFRPRTVDGVPVARTATLPLEFNEPSGCESERLLGWVVFGTVGVAFLVDMIVALAWVQGAWLLGLPLFRTTRRLSSLRNPLDDQLLHALGSSRIGIGPPLTFRRFAEGSVGFRESFRFRFFGFNYSPLMRGHIRFNQYANEIEVRGVMYASHLIFVALFVGIPTWLATERGEPMFGLFLLVALGFFLGIWAIQASRFRKVADIIEHSTK